MENFLLGISKYREFIQLVAMGIVFIVGLYTIITSDGMPVDCVYGSTCIIFSLFVIIYTLVN